MTQHLAALSASLSVTLHRFYPLAGTVRRSPDSEDGFEIWYKEGDAVSFTVAELAGSNFCDISGDHPREIDKLRLLAPKPASTGEQWPVLSVQMTLFPDQGFCIGVAVHHAACDGAGAIQFIKSWAAALCPSGNLTGDVPPPPFLDRSVIVDSHGVRRKLLRASQEVSEKEKKQRTGVEPPPPEAPHSSLVFGTFVLGPAMIGKLKKRVLEATAEEEGKPKFHCSSFMVACAYTWTCLVKARGYDGDSTVVFCYAVDWRRRMAPEIPSGYIGNCVGFNTVEMNVGDMNGGEGFAAAAAEIGRSIDGLKGMDVGQSIEGIIDMLVGFEGARKPTLCIGGSPKFRVYETDFGWGRPAKVEMTSIVGTPGAISLAESREEEEGFEIGVLLPKVEMDQFSAVFVGGQLSG
ncbi:Phenolic glucoside malonyltransferase 2 [Apostasia shenzhenica]|uniref:Phenolic glucoside malonyltransferase 2 n=1 Tax=Apostasia shenzhenica TaxID=1088818 RepID=A0A2I0BF53_9ASPA|nr:Phenolic glucoside malonyltransferase 2 [Apostasia shenzhenica]